jgi:sugar phosphate isomerase/epimerase
VAISPSLAEFGPLLFNGQLEAGLLAAHRAGFDMVELSLRSAREVEPGYLAELLSENRLDISAIATGRACLEDSLCLGNSNESVRARVLERIKENILLASRFRTAVIIGGIRGRLTGTIDEQNAQRASAVAAIRECLYFAKEHGVMLLIEPINRYETNFINTAAEGLQLLEEVGDTDLKLLLDTFHMNIEEIDLAAAIQEVGNRLGYLHFADSNRYAPGQGHLDFQSVIQAMKQVGYQGVITAEILPYPDDLTALRQAGMFFRKLMDKPSPEGEIANGGQTVG